MRARAPSPSSRSIRTEPSYQRPEAPPPENPPPPPDHPPPPPKPPPPPHPPPIQGPPPHHRERRRRGPKPRNTFDTIQRMTKMARRKPIPGGRPVTPRVRARAWACTDSGAT